MSVVNKKFTIKIYDPTGALLQTTLKPRLLRENPTFTSRINGGFGQCLINLNLPFDNFGEGEIIDFMNIVKVFASDSKNPLGRLIYTGFISAYKPFVRGTDQGVSLVLLGLVSLLNFAYYKNGANFTVNHTSEDPAEIMKAIINHFNTIYAGNLLGYDGSGTTVDTVGTNVDYTFIDRRWLEALQNTFQLAGGGWWWSLNSSGQLYLKQKPTSATHIFTIGKDIDSVIVDKSSEKVNNSVQVRYDASTADDSDATSQTNFGKRELIIKDNQIQNATTAAQRASQAITDKKDEKVKATLTVNAQFDIESVKVGDTCKIRNLSTDSITFTDNMQIVSIRYEWDQITIELEEISTKFGIELAKFTL